MADLKAIVQFTVMSVKAHRAHRLSSVGLVTQTAFQQAWFHECDKDIRRQPRQSSYIQYSLSQSVSLLQLSFSTQSFIMMLFQM
jgi:hypothetical protein